MKFDFGIVKKLFSEYGSKVLIALGILIIGIFVIRIIKDLLDRVMKNRGKDQTLRTFVVSLVNVILKLMLVLTVISILGIQIASFVAVIGAMGVAIGLALQGSLSNLAAGVLILFFRPFSVGNWIEVKGYLGKVKEIQIFHTVIIMENGTRVIIPNGTLSSGNIIIHTNK